MKTKMNIMKAAKMGLVSLALFAAPAFIFAMNSNESARIYDQHGSNCHRTLKIHFVM